MAEKKYINWDIKRGYGVYRSVYTPLLQRWIKEGRIKEGEVFVWRSGLSGWRRPEDMDEFRELFEKKERKKRIDKIGVPKVPPRKRKYPKVVIIDDEKEICWLLEKTLKERRYKVSSAYTGRSGINLVKQVKPDVTLLDLRLKDMDGLNVIRRIKKPRSRMKVIIISAYGNVEKKEKAKRLGADKFIDKPFKTTDVVKAIKQ